MKTARTWIVVLLMTIAAVMRGDAQTTPQQPQNTDTTASQQAEPAPKPPASKPRPTAPKPAVETKEPEPAPVPSPIAAEVTAAKGAAVAAEKSANDAAIAAAATQIAVDKFTKAASAESLLQRRLLIAIGILALAASILLTIPLFRRSEKPEEIRMTRRLNAVADKLDNGLQRLDNKLEKTGNVITTTLSSAVVTPDQLIPIRDDVGSVREEVVRVSREVQDIAKKPMSPAPDTDQVALERQVLAEWCKLFRSNNDLSAAVDNAARESTWMPLLKQLTKVVPPDLKPTFDTVVAPCEEHWSLIQKINLAPRVAGGEAGDLATPAEEVRRAREYAGLLQSAQTGRDAASRLHFRFKNWVTDTFLPFADLYLQRYQQAKLENSHRELEPGVAIVRQLLRIAAVEPIDVTPGETAFDSTRHIGRSTTNDHRFADGVITGVVRNGFLEGGQLIRQPEVIVNRTR